MFRTTRFIPKDYTIHLSRPISHYLSTPIFYVNSNPHVGHLYTLLIADAINRFKRLKLASLETKFSAGTDEHGIKIQTAAEANNISCKELCDKNSQKFSDLVTHHGLTVTDFIRTTDSRHKIAVETVWRSLTNEGYIYKNSYSGWYCSSDETFVPESQVSQREIRGKLAHYDSNDNLVTWSNEENYMFRFTQFQDRVLKWLVDEKPIVPVKFNHEAISMLKHSTMGDISISRPASRLSWGIPVPDDPSQTIYVWLDALTSYLTVVDADRNQRQLSYWPVDCQILGKDIIKFHAIYWPAFLMALSLHLPRRLICHSHWLIDSLKMSKSRGNVVDPAEEDKILTTEGLRYYLLRAGTPGSDTDYNQTQAIRRINSELADTYGNLLSRCCAPAINPEQHIPTSLIGRVEDSTIEIKERLEDVVKSCSIHYETANFYKALDELMAVLRLINAHYEDSKPWKLVKELSSSEDSYRKHSNVQAITFETLRISSILLQPIVPSVATKALDRMNVNGRAWSDARFAVEMRDSSSCSRSLNRQSDSVIFRRIKV